MLWLLRGFRLSHHFGICKITIRGPAIPSREVISLKLMISSRELFLLALFRSFMVVIRMRVELVCFNVLLLKF